MPSAGDGDRVPGGAVVKLLAFGEVCDPSLHEALKADSAQWFALPFVGIQDGGAGHAYCLRNCGCGSTLAKPVEVEVMPDKRSAL